MTGSASSTALLRALAPQVLGTLVRRYGQFDACEDALQEALLAASRSWPERLPDHPAGWLVTAASRRLIEMWRQDSARQARERRAARQEVEAAEPSATDDTLSLFFLCCHPALTPAAQLPLLLRAVGGLSTGEIARGLLLPEPTVGQRISRAKARLAAAGTGVARPTAEQLRVRLPAVRQALYLIFTEGSTASSGPALHRVELSAEAIRLTRILATALPADGEVAGLLALMLLTDARRPARTRPDGSLVPLAEQDRDRWDRAMIAEGVALLEATLPRAALGTYQLQAAIAAVHAEAARAQDTDWAQILALYDLLDLTAPGPMVTLNRIVALAMVRGPEAGLQALAATGPELAQHHRTHAVRAHLLDRLGDPQAGAEYREAARRTLSGPEQRYLLDRAARFTARAGPAARPR